MSAVISPPSFNESLSLCSFCLTEWPVFEAVAYLMVASCLDGLGTTTVGSMAPSDRMLYMQMRWGPSCQTLVDIVITEERSSSTTYIPGYCNNTLLYLGLQVSDGS